VWCRFPGPSFAMDGESEPTWTYSRRVPESGTTPGSQHLTQPPGTKLNQQTREASTQ